MPHQPGRLPSRTASLLAGVSLAALLTPAAHARAPAPFRSLNQALAAARGMVPSGSPAAAGNAMARTTLGMQNLQLAATKMRSLAQALAARPVYAATPPIADGLAPGGLQPAPGAAVGGVLWQNALLPTQSMAGGRTTVEVTQTAPTAVLNWRSFDISPKTDLQFIQAASNWVVLNRISDPALAPSRIFGSITAPGQVYVVNQNGVLFGRGSQVSLHSLVASTASIDPVSLAKTGLYSPDSATPIFTGAAAGVTVEAGASIATQPPLTVTEGGGTVLLIGATVNNAGAITAPGGQVAIAAGQDVILRPGFGSNGDAAATVKGLLVAVLQGGAAENTGILTASDGDVTLAGGTVRQNGVVLTSSSLGQRGTVHLLTDLSDTAGSVLLGAGSVTEIIPDTSTTTAIEALRARPTVASSTALNDSAGLEDNQVLARIEITTGGTASFEAGSLTLAPAGQVAVSARGSVFASSGATIDVAGLSGVTLPIASNLVPVSIEPFGLRDSPRNRQTGYLSNLPLLVDARTLLVVPASSAAAGDPETRAYTGGGLLEISGEVGNTGHTLAQYSTVGGTITLSTAAIVAQPGSLFNIAGGSTLFQGGAVQQSYLQGADGRIYNINAATDGVVYTGLYTGDVEAIPRWNITEKFINPLLTPLTRLEPGYTLGANAGVLNLAAPTTVFEGTIDGGAIIGAGQTGKPAAGRTGLLLGQSVVPQGGTLTLAPITLPFDAAGPPLPTDIGADRVVVSHTALGIAASLTAGGDIPADRLGTAIFDASLLDASRLGAIQLDAGVSLTVDSPVTVVPGGRVILAAPTVAVNATITAAGGSISIGGINPAMFSAQPMPAPTRITLGGTGSIVTRGAWTNALLTPAARAPAAFIDGGPVTLATAGSLTLVPGSVIDSSAGGFVSAAGVASGGAGGDITLLANQGDPAIAGAATSPPAPLTLSGLLRGTGASHGGTLTLGAPGVVIGQGGAPHPWSLVLQPEIFTQGFAAYHLISGGAVAVTPGTILTVQEPVYTLSQDAPLAPTGGDPAAAFQLALPPLFQLNGRGTALVQRQGASLVLDAPGYVPGATDSGAMRGRIHVGAGASIIVDPGESITLSGSNQVTVAGSLIARGGAISVLDVPVANPAEIPVPGNSIWFTSACRLDVSGIAAMLPTPFGQVAGIVTPGGSITIGDTPGVSDLDLHNATGAAIVTRPGAVFDASGASAAIDLPTSTILVQDGLAPPKNLVNEDSAGGTISLASNAALFLDGVLRAPSGGETAMGGTLSVTLETSLFNQPPDPALAAYQTTSRIITLTQAAGATSLRGAKPGTAFAVGGARLSADSIMAGGFSSLSLFARDGIVFDGSVSLSLPQAIALNSAAIADTAARGDVRLAAPYVLLSGITSAINPNGDGFFYAYGGTPLNAAMSQATLSVSASLIDIRNNVAGGLTGATIDTHDDLSMRDYSGFGSIALSSTGDLRFIGSEIGQSTNSLSTAQDLTFDVAQIYPITQVAATISAGGTLIVARQGDGTAAPPLSVLGALTLTAPTIIQGGVIRAPFGAINVEATQADFLPGSITSVTLSGETVPFGGTADGISYRYAGVAFSASYSRNNIYFYGGATYGVFVTGSAISFAPGSEIDLEGGGTLAGASFISGRGGSTDVLANALLSFDPSRHSVAAPTLGTTDAVYAILPGFGAYAPLSPLEVQGLTTYSQPAVGEDITMGASPGLAAGTYTLLPAYYALLPGAYRVELRLGTPAIPGTAQAFSYGTTDIAASIGIAGTSVQAAAPITALVTSGAAIRQYSSYDEEGYAEFQAKNPSVVLFGKPRTLLPADAAELDLIFGPRVRYLPSLVNDATVLFDPAAGGRGGVVSAYAQSPDGGINFGDLIVGDALTTAPGRVAVIDAGALDRFGADQLSVGGFIGATTQPTYPGYLPPTAIDLHPRAGQVTISAGATLSAPTVFVLGNGTLTVAGDTVIETNSRPATGFDSRSGLLFALPEGGAAIAASNGLVIFGPIVSTYPPSGITVEGGARLDASNTLAFATPTDLSLSSEAVFGAGSVQFSVANVNIGSGAAGQGASAPGLLLSQTVLDQLFAGDAAHLAPPLRTLNLTASSSLNVFGSASLNTIDPATGLSRLDSLVLNTPAIYGSGTASDAALITVGTLTWNGVAGLDALGNIAAIPPPFISPGTPGTGSGAFTIDAQTIVFGFAPSARPDDSQTYPRAITGFSNVTLRASQQITIADRGSLTVSEAQGDVLPDGTLSGTGGSLSIVTPLITGASRGTLAITAPGPVALSPGAAAPSMAVPDAGGAELDITAASITDQTAIVLPAGRILLDATVDIALLAGARLDVSGTTKAIFDQSVSSAGGEISLTSDTGNIGAAMGTMLAFAGAGAQPAGRLSVRAYAGTAALDGEFSGAATDPASSGQFSLIENTLPSESLADLGAPLSTGGVFGARSIEIRTGNLTITSADDLTAHVIDLALDRGTLTIDGLVNAAGAQPGTLSFSAAALTLTGQAVLDTRANAVWLDSYGSPIDGLNRADIALTSSAGSLTILPGATLNLASPDGVSRGDVQLAAPRGASGDILVSAQALVIAGAASVALNGFATYSPASGTIDQALLNAIDADSTNFVNAAGDNAGLQGRITGLSALAGVFHLRPGVIIDSAATGAGNLTVFGDLDLSRYRYGPTGREPGVLALRAANNLNIYGSISDGFAPAPATTDDHGWVRFNTVGVFGNPPGAEPNYQAVAVSTDVTLPSGTTLQAGVFALSYALPLADGAQLRAGHPVPVSVTLAADVQLQQGWKARAAITLPDGSLIDAGETIAAGTVLPAGTTLAAGSTLPQPFAIAAVTWPAGASLATLNTDPSSGAPPLVLTADVALHAGDIIPGSAVIALPGRAIYTPVRPDGGSGSLDGVASLLPAGTLSWSIDLVAGADLGSSRLTSVVPLRRLASQSGAGGNLVLDDVHYADPVRFAACAADPFSSCAFSSDSLLFSVIRTGTGSLSLAAGGAVEQLSPFGIYTAGAQSPSVSAANADSATHGYFPADGGDLTVTAGSAIATFNGPYDRQRGFYPTSPSNWLRRQGGEAGLASWGIDFGRIGQDLNGQDSLLGFVGFGALGGGNVTIRADGDAGAIGPGSDGLSVAVAATGQVISVARDGGVVMGGTLAETGGGALRISIGGDYNPYAPVYETSSTIVGLRGPITISAGTIGLITPTFSGVAGDPRLIPDPAYSPTATARLGLTVDVGDGTASIDTRGDLLLATSVDPGRVPDNFKSLPTQDGTRQSTYFSLWKPGSALLLESAGGNVSPVSDYAPVIANDAVDDRFEYPSTLVVQAQHGNIYTFNDSGLPVELAPSPVGQLSLLAAGSIFGSSLSRFSAIVTSGAAADDNALPNPFKPVYVDISAAGTLTNVGNPFADVLATANLSFANDPGQSLFAFEGDTPLLPGRPPGAAPIRAYALAGDVVNLTLGAVEALTTAAQSGLTGTPLSATWYLGSTATRVIAGRDIVDFGLPGQGGSGQDTFSGSLFVNQQPQDISVLEAGRDIITTNVQVAGPGLLYVQAGRDIYQADQGNLQSLGVAVVDQRDQSGSRAGGAAITVIAGAGAAGPDWTYFATTYLDDTNQADPKFLLTDPSNVGKVEVTHGEELLVWLQANAGYTGDQAGALAAFDALPPERRSIFLLSVYFDELRQSGREETNPSSRLYRSYARGRQAIATLFPDTTRGDMTLFGGSGVQTQFGGNITLVDPGGTITLGVTANAVPPSTAGLITFGAGDVNVYSLGSVLLGQSRVFTTFGGGITIWSAQGDINAGRGAKSTVVAQPFQLSYDTYADITLSPSVPAAGAGIASLNEIPGTPPGDVDLIAPAGTIDAGEAGIRASGNANLAARQIVNAANVTVQGKTTGVPSFTTPSTAAQAAVAARNGAATAAAQQATRPAPPSANPSILEVSVAVTPDAADDQRRKHRVGPGSVSYDPDASVQVLGAGELTPDQKAKLTDEERRGL